MDKDFGLITRAALFAHQAHEGATRRYSGAPFFSHPQLFDLSGADVRNQTVEGLRQIAEQLILDGWIRYRYLAGTHLIEMRRVGRDKIEEILFERLEDPPLPGDRLVIEVAEPRREYAGTLDDFLEGAIFRSWEENPTRGWRMCR